MTLSPSHNFYTDCRTNFFYSQLDTLNLHVPYDMNTAHQSCDLDSQNTIRAPPRKQSNAATILLQTASGKMGMFRQWDHATGVADGEVSPVSSVVMEFRYNNEITATS